MSLSVAPLVHKHSFRLRADAVIVVVKDPSYPEALARLPEYKASVLERYPPLCVKCEPVAEEAIVRAEYRSVYSYLLSIVHDSPADTLSPCISDQRKDLRPQRLPRPILLEQPRDPLGHRLSTAGFPSPTTDIRHLKRRSLGRI